MEVKDKERKQGKGEMKDQEGVKFFERGLFGGTASGSEDAV